MCVTPIVQLSLSFFFLCKIIRNASFLGRYGISDGELSYITTKVLDPHAWKPVAVLWEPPQEVTPQRALYGTSRAEVKNSFRARAGFATPTAARPNVASCLWFVLFLRVVDAVATVAFGGAAVGDKEEGTSGLKVFENTVWCGQPSVPTSQSDFQIKTQKQKSKV